MRVGEARLCIVYNYYQTIEELDSDEKTVLSVTLKCSTCTHNYDVTSMKNRSTGNAIRHLSDTPSCPNSAHYRKTVLKLDDNIMDRYVHRPKSQQDLESKVKEIITSLIFTSDSAYSLADNSYLHQLVYMILPPSTNLSNICSRRTIAANIDHKYTTELDKTRTLLKTCRHKDGKIHIGLDVWSSHDRTVLGVIAFITDNDYEQHEMLLKLANLHRQSGEDMAVALVNILTEFQIPLDSVLSIVSDNCGSNDTLITSFIDICLSRYNIIVEPFRSRCFSHIVSLSAKSFLSELKVAPTEISSELAEIITNEDNDTTTPIAVAKVHKTLKRDLMSSSNPVLHLRVVISHIHASPQRMRVFKSFFNEEESESNSIPQLDHLIRWNSTHYMLKGALKMRSSIDQYTSYVLQENGKKDLGFTEAQWKQLKDVSDILECFTTTSMLTQSPSTAILTNYFPLINQMYTNLEGKMKDPYFSPYHIAIKAATDHLSKYYSLASTPEFYVATYCNPSLGMNYFDSRGWKAHKDEAKEAIVSTLARYFDANTSESTAAECNQFGVSISGSPITVESEMSTFASLATKWHTTGMATKHISNPLLFYKIYNQSIPRLSRMALDYMTIPSSSASIERLFSSCGRTLTNDRTRLSDERLNATVSLKEWSKSTLYKKFNNK
eukprot:gene20793-24967_t